MPFAVNLLTYSLLWVSESWCSNIGKCMLDKSPSPSSGQTLAQKLHQLIDEHACDEAIIHLFQESMSHPDPNGICHCLNGVINSGKLQYLELFYQTGIKLEDWQRDKILNHAVYTNQLEALRILIKHHSYDSTAFCHYPIYLKTIYLNNSYLKDFNENNGGRALPDRLVLLAIHEGHLDMAQFLIEAMIKSSKNKSLLLESLHRAYLLACCLGHQSLVAYLVNHTSIVPHVESSEALNLACLNGNSELVDYLLSLKGIDPGAKQSKALCNSVALLFAGATHNGALTADLRTQAFIEHAPNIIRRLFEHHTNGPKKNALLKCLGHLVSHYQSDQPNGFRVDEGFTEELLDQLLNHCQQLDVNPYQVWHRDLEFVFAKLKLFMTPERVIPERMPDLLERLIVENSRTANNSDQNLKKWVAFLSYKPNVELLLHQEPEKIKSVLTVAMESACYYGYTDIVDKLFAYEKKHYGQLLTQEQLSGCLRHAISIERVEVVHHLLMDKRVSVATTDMRIHLLSIIFRNDHVDSLWQVNEFYQFSNRDSFLNILLQACAHDSARCVRVLLENNKAYVDHKLIWLSLMDTCVKYDSVQVFKDIFSKLSLSRAAIIGYWSGLESQDDEHVTLTLLGMVTYYGSVKILDHVLRMHPLLADEIKNKQLLPLALGRYVEAVKAKLNENPSLSADKIEPAVLCPERFKVIVELLKTPGQWAMLKAILTRKVDTSMVTFSDLDLQLLERLVETIEQERISLYTAVDVLHQLGMQTTQGTIPEELMAELLRDVNGLAHHHIGQQLNMPLYRRYLNNRAQYTQPNDTAMDIEANDQNEVVSPEGLKRTSEGSEEFNERPFKRDKKS